MGHTSIANIGELPLSLQLFAGGVSSVRGYGYNSIGPGRNLVVASSEVQQRIIGAFYLAGLVDAGVVANNNIFTTSMSAQVLVLHGSHQSAPWN